MLLAVTKHGLFILLREHRDNALEQNLSMLAVTKHGLNHTISGAHGQCFGANPEQRVFSEAPISTDSRTPPQPPYTVALRCVVQLHLWPQTSCFIVHRSSTQILHMLAVTKCGWYLEVTESEHMMHKLSLLVDSFLSSCPEDELAAQLGWRAELVRGEAGLWRLAACGLAYMLVL